MNSEPRGIGTSTVEVTNIFEHGIWLLAGGRELFLSYEDFPWFRDVSISQIVNVEEPTPEHFYWSALYVDLGLLTIEQPERFPLKVGRRYMWRNPPTLWLIVLAKNGNPQNPHWSIKVLNRRDTSVQL